MLQKLLFAAVIITTMLSCKSKAAFNYSQDFVKHEQSLSPVIQKAENKVTSYVGNSQFDSIGIVGEQMESLVESKLKTFRDKAAPDAKEGENFKAAGIKYFEFIKSLYTGYKNYGYAKTDDERDEMLAKIQKIVGERSTAISDIQSAQRKFAEANGFKVEGKLK